MGVLPRTHVYSALSSRPREHVHAYAALDDRAHTAHGWPWCVFLYTCGGRAQVREGEDLPRAAPRQRRRRHCRCEPAAAATATATAARTRGTPDTPHSRARSSLRTFTPAASADAMSGDSSMWCADHSSCPVSKIILMHCDRWRS